MITVHHLERSRSHRVLWLLEELEVPYQIKRYQREASMLAPEARKFCGMVNHTQASTGTAVSSSKIMRRVRATFIRRSPFGALLLIRLNKIVSVPKMATVWTIENKEVENAIWPNTVGPNDFAT